LKKSLKRNSIKDDAERLNEIVQLYKKACIYADLYDKKVYVINDKTDEDKIKKYHNFKIMFESFLNTLEEDEKLIIKNDFYERVHENWWIGLYSRSTYYRIKNRAIKKMLFYYE
jgi:DNA-directed RNA polymerase specialized sigma subunit